MLLSVPTSAEVLANVQPGDGVTTNLVSKAFGSEMSCCAVALDRHDWQGDDGRPEAAEFYVWSRGPVSTILRCTRVTSRH